MASRRDSGRAGPAGVASALALKDRGIRPLVLDAAATVASSWRRRYDRLRLSTCRPLSHLPGRRFRGTPMFPSRDDLIAHVERHAREDGIELVLGVRVENIDRTPQGWLVETSGEPVPARQGVVATGYEQKPVIPDWPRIERFAGTVAHAGDYSNARPYPGRRVLVVGAGCSGMEIAYDLAEGGASKVWLSARTPPNICRGGDRAAFRATSSAYCCCPSRLGWGTLSLASAVGWVWAT